LETACDKFEISKQRYIEREAQRTEKITARRLLSTKGTLKMSGR
jgi:acyl-[acyl-carrier-protein] desaturase